MYRITGYLFNTRNVWCRQIGGVQVNQSRLCLRHTGVKERETCPPPPPLPPPKPKDDKGFWGVMTVVFFLAGFAVCAKRSPEMRDWITIYAPWFDDLIAIAYEENMTYGEFTEYCIDELKKMFTRYLNNEKPKPCSSDGTGQIAPVPEHSKLEITENSKVTQDGQAPCVPIPPPVITKNICEIEECLKDFGETAINNYNTARDICLYYNKLVEETMTNFSIPTMKELRPQMVERMDLVRTSLENAVEAIAYIDELTRYLECGVQAPQESIEKTKGLIQDYRTLIKTAEIQYQWEDDRAVAMDGHWQKVEELLDKYTDETQTMFPEVKYNQNKLQLSGDPDLLLYHTYRYSRKLRAELNDVISNMSERVNRGVETLPQGEKEKKARDAEIQSAYTKRKNELDKEFNQRCDDLRASNEKQLKEALRAQLQSHQESLQKQLEQKEQEVTVKFNRMVSEKVTSEKKNFAKMLAEMAAKLRLVEDKLNARLKAESETKRSQEMWMAGTALLRATKKGEPYVNVSKELKAIAKASGDGDKLVSTVLKAIPDTVLEKGVVPESVLRNKYNKMEKLALRVALVEEDGAPLPVYFLSWIQSTLLFMKLSTIPQIEIDKPLKEPFTDLDTFDLLQRARFWLERGNLALAIRYVNSLEGASRAAAVSWYEAARCHLETRQAAEAVIAHAAAIGLQYI